MTYIDACRALGIDVLDLPQTPDKIKEAFKQRVKQIHPDHGVPELGGPTVDQLKEARALLLHLIGDVCPACEGLTFVKTLGSVKKCPTCRGLGRITP